jgi:glycine/D-amino acid oxidase-like deaminating enzyme
MRRRGEGLPPIRPRSWWLESALCDDAGQPCPPLTVDTKADVCIVGAGFTGLWTAYELTQRAPHLGVVIIERDVCGAGGSGTNGGFFSPSWCWLDGLCRALGEDGGLRWARALADQVDELGEWVVRHEAHIDHHREGILFARTGEWQQPASEETLALLSRHGLADRLRLVDAKEARRVADSPRFLGGAFADDLATVQPAKLARELRRVLLERGVRVYEETRMTRIEPGRPLRVATVSGSVRAGQVVVATGAWAAADRHFRRAFAVCVDHMVVTEPIPELLEGIGWSNHVGIADSRELVYYVRRTDDGRIALGGGAIGVAFGARVDGLAATSARLSRTAALGLSWLFPSMKGVRFDAAWSGPMDMTPAGLPFFESSEDGRLHAGLGYSGHGLTATKVGGKVLASRIVGSDDEWGRLPTVGPPMARVPREPLRWPMVRGVVWAHERGERARERGRRPSALKGSIIRTFDSYVSRVGRASREAVV